MRLRRTIAGALTLCLVVSLVVTLSVRDDLHAVADRALLVRAGPAGASAPAPAPKRPAPDLPDGSTRADPVAEVPHRASGKLRAVPVRGRDSTGPGRRVTYSVEIERGLGANARQVARIVHAVLTDRRGWETEDHVRFVHVSPARQRHGADVDIRVTLASPALTDKLCAPLKTRSKLDCFNTSRAVLNYRNWQHGIPAYAGDLRGYRTYLINHEVGHGLGFGHEHCTTKGAAAQVMIQQTISLEGCTPWPWPTRPDSSR